MMRHEAPAEQPANKSGETPDVPVNWGRVFGYLRPYWKQMVVAFLALLVSSGLSLVFPAVIQQVVDSVLVAHDIALLDQITLLLLVVFLIRSISSLVRDLLRQLRRRESRGRPAAGALQPSARPLARLLLQTARRRTDLAPLQRRDHDPQRPDQQHQYPASAAPDRDRLDHHHAGPQLAADAVRAGAWPR